MNSTFKYILHILQLLLMNNEYLILIIYGLMHLYLFLLKYI